MITGNWILCLALGPPAPPPPPPTLTHSLSLKFLTIQCHSPLMLGHAAVGTPSLVHLPCTVSVLYLPTSHKDSPQDYYWELKRGVAAVACLLHNLDTLPQLSYCKDAKPSHFLKGQHQTTTLSCPLHTVHLNTLPWLTYVARKICILNSYKF